MVTLKKLDAPATPGGVESLDDIAREASGLQAGEQAAANAARQAQEQAQAGQAQAQQAQARVEAADEVQAVAGLLGMARDMAAELLHEAALLPYEKTMTVWSDKRLLGISAPLVAVLNQHEESLGPVIKAYGPLVALAGALAIPTVGTIKAVRAHRAKTVTVESRVVPDAAGGAGGAGGGAGG